ncbi:hypothetical protein C8J56DRAFT_770612, partial [Mycena floridula]
DECTNFEDRAQLPYLEALNSNHRAVPSGLPHCTTEDDIHDEYFITEGSIIIQHLVRSLGFVLQADDPDIYI